MDLAIGGDKKGMNIPIERELLTIADAQRLTGESESCWRKRLSRREIPFIRCGANVRIRRQDFEQWLRDRTVPRKERA